MILDHIFVILLSMTLVLKVSKRNFTCDFAGILAMSPTPLVHCYCYIDREGISLGYSLERAPMVLMALRAMTAHILSQICAVVFTSPLTSRLCSQLQELQELPTSPLRMWSSSKKHQLILTLAPGPGVEPGSRGHKADALPLSYPHILPLVHIWYLLLY